MTETADVVDQVLSLMHDTMRNSGATWFTHSSVYQAVGTERVRANQAQFHGSRWCRYLHDSSHDKMARWERESHRTLVGSASLASGRATFYSAAKATRQNSASFPSASILLTPW